MIYVDKITSISESIFSFRYKGKMIAEPFAIKEKPEKNRTGVIISTMKIWSKFINIFRKYTNSTLTSESVGLINIEEMKKVLERIIKKGNFVQLLSKLYETSIENTEIRWDSESHAHNNPVWLNIDIPSKVCTIHSNPQCTYVEQKKETPFKGIGMFKRDGGWLRFENIDETNRFCDDQYSDYKLIVHC